MIRSDGLLASSGPAQKTCSWLGSDGLCVVSGGAVAGVGAVLPGTAALFVAGGDTSAGVSLPPNGTCALAFLHEKGRAIPRACLALLPDGTPCLMFSDAQGALTWAAPPTVSAPLPSIPLALPRVDRSYNGVGGGHWARAKLDGGRMVLLEDGSVWEIEPLGRIDVMLWLPLEDITVLEGSNPLYPYKLVNVDSRDVVEAKYVGRQ